MDNPIFQLTLLLNILLAAALGFFIGFERKLRVKEAGIRTHTIVCIGSALIMVVSKSAFDGMDADVSRVAAQIVSGIGFLGAGIIMFRGQKLHGLTTAAGVWATAGVGMACGGGLYLVAIGATVILIGIQCLLHIPVRMFRPKKYYIVNIVFEQVDDANLRIKEIFGIERFNHLQIERKDDCVLYRASLYTNKEHSSTELDAIIKENPFIHSIERCDEE